MEHDLFDTSKLKKKPADDKKPEKKVEAVVTTARTKKKSEVQKFAEIFFPGDITNIRSYFLTDVLIPNVKKAISDGVDMLLYGETGRTKKSGISKISYSSFYKNSTLTDPRERQNNRSRGALDYDDIVFESRGDAETVLTMMEDICEQYGQVSVADLYDLAGITTNNWTVGKYGWTNVHSANVARSRDGFVIKLPKAMPID